MSCDILVIGGGPAGLSAALNARARGRSVLVVSNPPEENPLWRAGQVDNYPGLPGVSGQEMLLAMRRQAEEAGAEFLAGRALSALFMMGSWFISVGPDMYSAKAVVLAAGVARGKKFPGEAEFLGRGVSYCATCDGMMYRNRPVAVIGLREDAPEEAEFLRSIGCQVEYFDRSRARDYRILGEQKVTGLAADGTEYPVDGVFILRPGVAPDMLLPGLETDRGTIVTDREMRTNIPGVFAAGDCTGAPYPIAKSVGEGNLAALSAVKYLYSKKE